MPKRPTSADVAALAGVSRTTVSFVLNDRADVKIPDETRRRVVRCRRASSATHPNASARQLAGGRSHVIALVLRQSPEQVASDAVLAETLRGLAVGRAGRRLPGHGRAARARRPGDTYVRALLRAQHADGLVVSGPRSDDPSLLELVRDGFPIVLQGVAARTSGPERRRRQRRRGARRGRAPPRARPSPDRLHHQRAARLHRGPGTPRRLSARRSGRRPRRSTAI